MTKANLAHDPLIRISKREDIPMWKSWLVRIIGLLLALVVSGIVIVCITHINPFMVFAKMASGSFGSWIKNTNAAGETVEVLTISTKRIWVTIRDIMTLLCISVGLAPAFAMKFWNVGAEGQVLVGGIATVACMKYFTGLPTIVLVLVMIVVSMLAGAIWGFFPGFFKAHWNTNETLFTLMMNYIAIQITSFMVAVWENPPGSNSVGVINRSDQYGWLPSLFSDVPNKDFGWNVIIVLIVTVAVFIYLRYSKQGYEISVVGDSVNTARYAGIRVKKVYIRTMAISGAICGLAGFVAVSGASHTISTSTAGGRGFTAIIVAWLAKFNTFTMILISALLVVLDKGASEIASSYGINEYVSQIITGIILFFLLGSEFFINYQLKFRHYKGAEPPAAKPVQAPAANTDNEDKEANE
ncbi:MAG: ABC transporter permease [Lachnospiraceae bacterium]|nr:ABC transporter permease [Lachnospiraceae bacterium]